MLSRRMGMARYEGYGKPNMTNLSGELGKAIMRQIMETAPPDLDKMLREANEIEDRIIKARKNDDED